MIYFLIICRQIEKIESLPPCYMVGIINYWTFEVFSGKGNLNNKFSDWSEGGTVFSLG
jgi:hypothetical protein